MLPPNAKFPKILKKCMRGLKPHPPPLLFKVLSPRFARPVRVSATLSPHSRTSTVTQLHHPPQTLTNTHSQPPWSTPIPHHNTFPTFSLYPCPYSPNTYTPTHTTQTPCPSTFYPIQCTHAPTPSTHAPVLYTACPYSHAVITEN